jgi:hypothetical protein
VRGNLVNGSTVFKYDFRETSYEDVNWIKLAQNKTQWQAFESMMMKTQVL